jgi:hypothetical protein
MSITIVDQLRGKVPGISGLGALSFWPRQIRWSGFLGEQGLSFDSKVDLRDVTLMVPTIDGAAVIPGSV